MLLYDAWWVVLDRWVGPLETRIGNEHIDVSWRVGESRIAFGAYIERTLETRSNGTRVSGAEREGVRIQASCSAK